MTTANATAPVTHASLALIGRGTSVTGTYHGVPFAGMVRAIEADTCAIGMVRYYVNLSAPITVYESVRESIIVTTFTHRNGILDMSGEFFAAVQS